MSDAQERIALDILYDASVDYDQLPISMAGRCYAVLDAMIAENARLRDQIKHLEWHRDTKREAIASLKAENDRLREALSGGVR